MENNEMSPQESPMSSIFFFLNDPAPPEISPLSLHGALPIWIALVIASCSGGGGAALSRRNYGETIAHLTEATRYPYQFAANYAKYANQVDRLPVDGHRSEERRVGKECRSRWSPNH